MRTLLNIIWLVFGGFWLALGYIAAGIVFCILIVTIPLGVASFRMASFAFWPFGRSVVPKPGAGGGAAVMNVIWFVLAGWWLALCHIVTAFAQAITIIGIPLAVANVKMIPVTVVPFGKEIVPSDSLTYPAQALYSMPGTPQGGNPAGRY